jgi:hypothetical protein
MTEISETSFPASLPVTPSAISSQALEAGPTHSGLPDGPMTEQSGPAPAPASLSARQAKEKGLLTSGTYGLAGSTLSSTASQPGYQSLVSRLRQRMLLLGSTLFTMTWKERVTASGRRISALRGSGRRTSDKDSISWPTPQARDHFPAHSQQYFEGKKAEGHGMANLNDHVSMAMGWPTPCAQDGPNGGPNQGIDRLPGAAAWAGWPTPNCPGPHDSENTVGVARPPRPGYGLELATAAHQSATGWASPKTRDSRSAKGSPEQFQKTWEHARGKDLEKQAYATALIGWQTPGVDSFRCRGGERKDEMGLDQEARYLGNLTGWSTPTSLSPATDTYNGAGNSAGLVAIREQAIGATSSLSVPTPKENIGALNPAFVCWLMGYPKEWDGCAATAMPSSRKSRKK